MADATTHDLPADVVVRPARHADLAPMSRLHVELLPVGVFPSLGTRFVRRWQRTFLDSPYGVAYVAVDPVATDRGVVGFLTGTTDHSTHMTALLSDRRTMAALAVAVVAALARRPRVATRLLRSRMASWVRRLRTRRRARVARTGRSCGQVAVMVALAVRPRWRGHGVGEQLVAHFLEHSRIAGAATAELVTPTGPAGAAGFYERLGWEAGPDQHTRDGDGLRVYRRRLGRDHRDPTG